MVAVKGYVGRLAAEVFVATVDVNTGSGRVEGVNAVTNADAEGVEHTFVGCLFVVNDDVVDSVCFRC
jgi:hypothetical protein